MSKKISLRIGSVLHDVVVEEPFYDFLVKQVAQDFNISGNNDLKVLLKAYVKKNHELFIQEQKMRELILKLENQN
ncbi:MAG: hypothetical protein PHI89_08040 [Thiovulaceae bacterium]|jgi:hypothetical protein|nr:hypothetical protein [Sulfurimonadaceae bacterium]MDD3818022.1 hypothetical protein [Sulfurimonadaceae bacterium]